MKRMWISEFAGRVLLTLFALAAITLAIAGRQVSAQPPARGPAFTCNVINSTATALTAFVANGIVVSNCAATPGQAMFITDVTASASAIATTTSNEQLQLKVGTGTACATGTITIWNAFNLAATAVEETFATPVRVPANTDLCWMDAVAGNKSFIVSGYYGQ